MHWKESDTKISLVLPCYTLGNINLEIDGAMTFGPNWNYEYHIKGLSALDDATPKAYTAIRRHSLAEVDSDTQFRAPKTIDIIIQNNKDNPGVLKIIEKQNDLPKNKTKHKKRLHKQRNKHYSHKAQRTIQITNDLHSFTEQDIVQMPERTYTYALHEPNTPHRIKKHKRKVLPLRMTAGRIEDTTKRPHKTRKHRRTKERATRKETTVTYKEFSTNPTVAKKHKRIKKNKTTTSSNVHDLVEFTDDLKKTHYKVSDEHTDSPKTTTKIEIQNGTKNDLRLNTNATEISKGITVEDFPKGVTELVEEIHYKDMFVTPHLVKDDSQIKEFTKHVYEQSIKVLEGIKEKMTDYRTKRTAEQLIKSYEEKFGDFVRDTQNQKIKTRLGRQKVILNTIDTSNRILDRLTNYLMTKMDKKGVLRNQGIEHVILNEINKKKDLENKHVCNKMQICPSQESFPKYLADILTIVLSCTDDNVVKFNNAATEVLKNTDFNHFLNTDSEKRYQKGLSNLEKYKVDILKPIYFILKNIITFKNNPIKVVGPEDSRVNKTMAFLEILDTWDKKLSPNEKNILDWNDSRNSFKEWKEGKRNDLVDLVQHLVDQILSVMNGLDIDEVRNYEKNLNMILGY